jgi:bifunctional UDP-N-acetylglucosamine pyrophosphorylase/glucosamine-1-phosphate N-acetyltransferase
MELDISSVVLAAGEGKRMRSSKSKVLFLAAGRPLVAYPLLALSAIGTGKAVVVASPKNRAELEPWLETLRPSLGTMQTQVAVQERQLGTGDAVKAALPQLTSEWTLILYGDGPLILKRDLESLTAAVAREQTALAMLTCSLKSPTGYGRVLLDESGRSVVLVREERDLGSDAERRIELVNPGVYLVRTELLGRALAALEPNNTQGEYYLTDIVSFAAQEGRVVPVPGDATALDGVNDRLQLQDVEKRLFRRIAEEHALAGVTFHGDAFVDSTVEIEADAEIGQGVVLRGATRVGAGAVIDVGCVVTDSVIEGGAWLKPYSVIARSSVAEAAQIGPFAHLRPGSRVEREAHAGAFVETKQATLGPGAKAGHLAYLGDIDVGPEVNIGAGTIVCNYDGFQKWRSTIGEGAFIGSDSQIVSPVHIGKNAYVATGSTVTEDVPDDAMAIGRVRQANKPGYARALKERLRARPKAAKK